MNVWRPYPLLRIVIPYAAGILLALLAGDALPVVVPAGILLAALAVMAIVFSRDSRKYSGRVYAGMLINLFMLAAGSLSARLHLPGSDPYHVASAAEGIFVAAIDEPPPPTPGRTRVVVKVVARRSGKGWVRASGKAMVTLERRSDVDLLHYGDRLLLRGAFAPVRDNGNPHAFNYTRYLYNRGITHRLHAEPWEWKLLPSMRQPGIRGTAFAVRDRLLDILRTNGLEGREFAVAAALLLGYVDDLDAGLRSGYAASGAMHILSVSGMHVGVIFIFLEFVLGFLDKRRLGKVLKAVFILASVWFYAMITGLSPSVFRSAAMLSLPILAKGMNRPPDMTNVLSASLLLLLAIDPFLLADTGFQLSYLAVAGIMVFYKPLYDLYVTSAWLPDKVWAIVAVSLAAQAATLPLTLYVFRQFPNYFLLTNIAVVPLSSLVIYSGIVLMAVSPVPLLANLVARVLEWLVWLLNTVILAIEWLPGSVTKGISLTMTEMILLSLAVVLLYLFLQRRRAGYLIALLAVSVAFGGSLLEYRVQRLRSARLTVFNVSRGSLFMFSAQDRAVLCYHSYRAGIPGPRALAAPALPAIEAQGIRFTRLCRMPAGGRMLETPGFVPLVCRGRMILYEKCRIALVDEPPPSSLKSAPRADVVILRGSPRVTLARIHALFHPREIVLDASNSRYRVTQWTKEADSAGYSCHAVAEEGAFEKEF